jgi:hypothetical protein
MASEAGVYDNLLFAFGLCEFDQEDFGGEVVDVGNAKGNESIGQLMCYDLDELGMTDTWTDRNIL